MDPTDNRLSKSAVELLELSRLDSPFTPELIAQHRRRLVQRMVDTNKIDTETAASLLE